jgi:hypothetical protein
VDELRASARRSTVTMAEDVRDKLVAGHTTIEELERVLPPYAIEQFRSLTFEGDDPPGPGASRPDPGPARPL